MRGALPTNIHPGLPTLAGIRIAFMNRFQPAIFLSALLLFLVQPMIAKILLPRFGGTAAVWTACMLFFQGMLLAGYFYSHLLRQRLSPRTALRTHAVLLACACCMLPVLSLAWLPTPDPVAVTWSVVVSLALTIGLPYFALATSGPLIQTWHHCVETSAEISPKRTASTWRLFALSNLGSLIALAAYPVIIEPLLTIDWQVFLWSTAFLVFATATLVAGSATRKFHQWDHNAKDASKIPASMNEPRVRATTIALWSLLSFCASVVLLSTTNLMCQEIAPVPFLWVLPLGLYLVSFIICFDRPGCYRRGIFTPLLLVSIISGIIVAQAHIYVSITLQIVAMSAVCFFVAMTCHGELERSKPPASSLTFFYLVIAAGGAAGGILVALLAPRIFDRFFEFPVSLLLCLVLLVVCTLQRSHRHSDRAAPSKPLLLIHSAGCFMVAALVIATLMVQVSDEFQQGELFRQRNEYGIVSVVEDADGYRKFVSGNVDHGGQFVDQEREFDPVGYYGESSGIAIALRLLRNDGDRYRKAAVEENNGQRGVRVGVVGMGVGAMLTWCQPEDHFTFYELNPLVESIARQWFTWLDHFKNQTTVHIGDGRLVLQQQLDQSGSQQFDLIVMDAFSSDAIPQHLLTRECFQLYLQHLSPDGLLVAHITNRFVDLRPVVLAAADSEGLTAWVRTDATSNDGRGTVWIVMSRDASRFQPQWLQPLADQTHEMSQTQKHILWTDDFASLWPIVNWSTSIEVEDLIASRQRRANPNVDSSTTPELNEQQ